jgi:hypothetical protein
VIKSFRIIKLMECDNSGSNINVIRFHLSESLSAYLFNVSILLRCYFAYVVKFSKDGKEKIGTFDIGKFFQPQEDGIHMY